VGEWCGEILFFLIFNFNSIMKKFGFMLLALLTVVGVSAFGFEQAGPLGSVAALGLGTSAVAYLFDSAHTPGGMLYAAIGPMRPLRRNESNLGGIIRLSIFTESQFTPGSNWPVRAKGKVTTAIPLLASETAAAFTFDVGTCKGSWVATGPITNQTYKHAVEFDVSGFHQEQLDTIDDLYNQGIIAIATYANDETVIYGSTRAFMLAAVSGDTGAKPEDDGKKTKVKFEQFLGCDFPPRKVGSGLVYTVTSAGAYPTQVNGVTP
jgi:hypothetical protein